MRTDACPSDEMLAAFNLGDLPEAMLDAIEAHQESCPRCEAKAQLHDSRTDAVIEDLRRSVFGAGAEDETDVAFGRGDRPPSSPTGGDRGSRVEGQPPRLPDYDVEGLPLGTGSTGIVYKARHRKLDRVVALKMIAGKSSRASALFPIEAKAVARLQHPNIVQIFEIGEFEGEPFLALEFVGGGSLERNLAGLARTPHRAAETLRTLALAVDHAHRQGIVHCDLKPANILVTAEGVPKISDFGVAKWLPSDDHWVREGRIVGTPRYMAPEQASGSVRCIGPTTDVYSLGVILYEMLAGRTPHDAVDPLETLRLVREQEPIALERMQPGLPRDLATIVAKCLCKEPARRYADAKALADDLGRFLADEPIEGRPLGRLERAYLRARRHPVLGGCLALALGILAWAASPVRNGRHQAILPPSSARPSEGGPPSTSSLPPGRLHGAVVEPQVDGSIRLGAAAADVHGNSLVFEPPFANLGYWLGPDDYARWAFRADRPATYTVALEYSNATPQGSPGNAFRIRVGSSTLRGEAVGTGSWSDFRVVAVGVLSLPAGVHRLEVHPDGPVRGPLFDLRAVTLLPNKEEAPPLPSRPLPPRG